VNTAGALLQRASASYAGGVCGSYGSFATIATGPATPYTDTVTSVGCYKYQYVMTDNVGNTSTYTSANVVKIDYSGIVQGTAGLSSYWRMGVDPNAADSFTGAASTVLSARPDDTGQTWTKHSTTAASTTVLTNTNRIRKNGTGEAAYYSSAVPASADYAVEADLLGVTPLMATHDSAGVEGRLIDDNNFYYTFYNVDIDGVLQMNVTDSSLTAAGRGGVRFGITTTTSSPTNTTSVHLDDFRLVPNTGTTMTATVGTDGTFTGSPLINTIGGTSDLNSSTQWLSSSTYADVPDNSTLDVGDGPFSVEAWVRRAVTGTTMQTILQKGTGAYQFGFYNNKIGLYKYTGGGVGTIIAQSTGTQTDTTAFHHYVATKNGSAVKIYVDGVDVTGTVTNQTLADTSSVLRLGGGSAGEFLNAYTDEVAVYKQVLPPATVTDHYNAGS
jgi:hypothetical protein